MAADTTLTSFVVPNAPEYDPNVDAALHAAGVGDLINSLRTAVLAAHTAYCPTYVPGANAQKRLYDRLYAVIGAYMPGSGYL